MSYDSSSEKAIEHVLSLFSHELRTPATALQGSIELLQTYQDTIQAHNPEDLQRLLDLAADSTHRLTRVIETLLDWCEVIQGTQPLFKQSCNLVQVIQQVVTSLQPLASHQHIPLQLKAAAELTLWADEYYLRRALSYVLHNAIKFSSPGQVVNITATEVLTQTALPRLDPPYALIAIQDQGIGIPQTELDQIFQPFHQIDDSDQRQFEGLGLELTICREIIHRHQGAVWVNSQPGQGSTFYVALPLES